MKNALVKLRDAAEVANGNAQEILGRYRRKLAWSDYSNSGFPHIARAQQRAAARTSLLNDFADIRRIHLAVQSGGDANALDATDLIRRAVVSVLKTPPIFVGSLSYPTAHEAALALGEAVHDAWQNAGGYDAVERAPDKSQAEADGNNADIAVEVSDSLWRRLRRLRKRLPADLWGQIQQEFAAAWTLLELEEGGNEPNRIGRDEADTPPTEPAKKGPAFVDGGNAPATNTVQDADTTAGFHVFLSHSSKNKPIARDLKRLLADRGLDVWLDEDELRPGVPWQPVLESGIRTSRSVAVLVGSDGLGPWEDQETQAALHRAVEDKRPVIAVLLPGTSARPDLPLFLEIRTWVDLRDGFTEEGLDKLVWGITGQKLPETPKP